MRPKLMGISRKRYRNLLENTSLLSPINGVVTARNYDSGDMYSGGEPVLVVEQILGEIDHQRVRNLLHPSQERRSVA